MTAQTGEILVLNGERLEMSSEPLHYFLQLAEKEEIFACTCSDCLRGYWGTWKIEDDRLYLMTLEGKLKDGSYANLATLFPDARDEIFANWFSGVIRCPKGNVLHYVHLSYLTRHEEDLFLEFENGVLVKQWVVDNREQ